MRGETGQLGGHGPFGDQASHRTGAGSGGCWPGGRCGYVRRMRNALLDQASRSGSSICSSPDREGLLQGVRNLDRTRTGQWWQARADGTGPDFR